MPAPTYLIVSPCRNEARFMASTLDSVLAQSILPTCWVIVDDGSDDSSPAILSDYAERYDFINIVTRVDRGHRSVGPGVVEAFYDGLSQVDIAAYDYLCKLDLDLILPSGYFETLMIKMQANPRLGNASGKPYFVTESGQLVSEGCGDENAIGAAKFYRRTCFEEIGGFVQQVMWDGIDGHRCRQYGWVAKSWDDKALRFTHLRPMGSSQTSIIAGRIRHGFGQYFMGTGFVYMLLSALFRMTKRPYFYGGLAMLWGYIRSWFLGLPQFEDKQLVTFIRRYQWACLFKGKKRATAELNQKQDAIWQQRHLG